MGFSEQPPSKQWAALKYRGEKFAEVCCKPEGEPLMVQFRIPKESFQIPGIAEQLTLENLLKAVGVAPADVESWRHGDVAHSGMHGSDPQLTDALVSPSQQVMLDISVRLRPQVDAVVRTEPEISSATWQDLETRWKAILTLEAAMDSLRESMDSLLAEMEGLWKRPLTMEEKTYAPRADVALWNKAKTRVLNALPKMKDFVHRSIWAMGSPERKHLGGLYDDHIQPHLPFPDADEVLKQLEGLRKERQVLSTHGKSVYQECKGISAELQGTLRTLHNNAANAKKKKDAASKRHF